MVKVRFVVNGRVQGIGYRALVKQAARILGIKGLVKNLEDGTVEIFCEAEEENIGKFKKLIDRESAKEDPFSINVTKIDSFSEGDKNYINPPKKFERFDVDYDGKLTSFEKESLDRSETGILLLADSRENIGGMHEDMNVHFNKLDESYGAFAEKMESMDESIKEMKDLFKKFVDHFLEKG